MSRTSVFRFMAAAALVAVPGHGVRADGGDQPDRDDFCPVRSALPVCRHLRTPRTRTLLPDRGALEGHDARRQVLKVILDSG